MQQSPNDLTRSAAPSQLTAMLFAKNCALGLATAGAQLIAFGEKQRVTVTFDPRELTLCVKHGRVIGGRWFPAPGGGPSPLSQRWRSPHSANGEASAAGTAASKSCDGASLGALANRNRSPSS